MTQSEAFAARAAQKAGDETHRKWILRVINNYDVAVRERKQNQFHDWQAARREAAAIKDYALAHLPELLEQFERNITARGAHVLWAADKEQAQAMVLEIARAHGVQRVVKSKSMTTEEIELNELLEERGVEILETDLGELIVQLAGEKPYHIVTPAMHKTRHDVSKLFHEQLGSRPSEDPAELTQVARDYLRRAYVNADLGITGGNFLIAEQGAIAITENEGNARLSVACPPVHVAIVGIEKVLPKLEHLALFWPLLATSGTGQQITSYNSIIRGPRRGGEPHGPDELYVILLDNGRSRIYANERVRHVLRCIRCGACLNACPVFRTVGGHSYDTAYNGPIGAVITPHLKGFEEWGHLSFASSLCGACTDACPVRIDLHHLLLENRFIAAEQVKNQSWWKLLLRGWAWVFGNRAVIEAARRLAWFVFKLPPAWIPERVRRVLPAPPERSFAAEWALAHPPATSPEHPAAGARGGSRNAP